MQVNDVVYCLFSATKKTPPKWCRSIVQEVNGPIARCQIWDGTRFTVRPLMIKDLKTKDPNEI